MGEQSSPFYFLIIKGVDIYNITKIASSIPVRTPSSPWMWPVPIISERQSSHKRTPPTAPLGGGRAPLVLHSTVPLRRWPWTALAACLCWTLE